MTMEKMTEEGKVVAPAYFSGWNMCLWGSPKWHIRCGNCGADFKTRIPMIDRPRIICPACRALNEVPVIVGTIGEGR